MRSTESGFVIGPSNILFAGVYVCTFQPGNFTSCGSEGVKGYILQNTEILLSVNNIKVCLTTA